MKGILNLLATSHLLPALRALRRAPGFTLAALLALCLGIGANTAILGALRTVFLRPLPFQDPGRLVALCTLDRQRQFPSIDYMPVSAARLVDWGAGQQAFTDLAATTPRPPLALGGQGDPLPLPTLLLTENYFTVAGVRPVTGRLFQTGDADQEGVVISQGLWRSRFGADPALIGRSLVLSGKAKVVLGVAPDAFATFMDADLFLPLRVAGGSSNRGANQYHVIARLRPGVSQAQALQDVDRLGRALSASQPGDRDWGPRMVPLRDLHLSWAYPVMKSLGLAGALLMAITCANVAALMVVRSHSRRRDVAVRKALGATFLQVLAPFFWEALLLSLIGALLGLGVAHLGQNLIQPFIPETLGAPLHLDVARLGLATSLSLVAALLSALVPALAAWRAVPQTLLAQEGKGVTGGRGRVQKSLVVVQLALSMGLLAGVGLLSRNLLALHRIPLGMDPRGVLTFQITPPGLQDDGTTQGDTYMRTLLAELAALPGVRSACATNVMPLADNGGWNGNISIPGLPHDQTTAQKRCATPDFFTTLGIPLVKGRTFTAGDMGSTAVVVVNEAFARKFFPGQEALGRTFEPGIGPGGMREIIGIVKDVQAEGPGATSFMETFYLPSFGGAMGGGSVALKVQGQPKAQVDAVRAAVKRLDGGQVPRRFRVLETSLDQHFLAPTLQLKLLGALAGLAVTLAGTGLLGILAFTLSLRERELAIRTALGATPRDLAWTLAHLGAGLLASGLALGLPAAWAIGRLLQDQLTLVGPTDALTFLGAALALAFAGTLALLPVLIRLMRLQPAQLMRG